MSTPETPDLGDMLFARMDDASSQLTVNDASFQVAYEATMYRAEQSPVGGYPAEPAPPLT